MNVKILNSFHLKLITVLSMIFGSILMQYNYPMVELAAAGNAENTELPIVLFQIGYAFYIAVMPVAGFLLVEGLMHTSNKGKMIARLALAAVAAQILIVGADYVTGLAHCPAYRLNFYFTMLLAAAAILVVEQKIKKFKEGTLAYNLLSLLVFLAAATIALMSGADQSHTGVMIMIAIYMFRSNPLLMVVSVAALQILLGNNGIFTYAPVVGIFLTFLYNGEKGVQNKATRAIFYMAYPVAYVALTLILRCVL
ncbi:MAG: hypothetical protein ACI4FZ_06030 [Lachnospiraceae bacterium]